MAKVELQGSYDSDSEADEEFEMLEADSYSTQEVEELFKLTEQTTAKLQTMISKILISIPFKGQTNKYKTYLRSLDSGASTSLADENLFKSSLVTKREGRGSTWKIQVGNFPTSKVADVTDLRLPQFTRSRKVDATFHLFNKQVNNCYSFILGRDLCQNIGLGVLNSQKAFLWDGIQVNMVPRGHWTQVVIKGFWDHENKERKEELESKEEILEAKYK